MMKNTIGIKAILGLIAACLVLITLKLYIPHSYAVEEHWHYKNYDIYRMIEKCHVVEARPFTNEEDIECPRGRS
jgi:hypothetical protein